MKRVLAWPALLCAVLFLFSVGMALSSSEEKAEEEDYMLLNKQVYKFKKAGPVKFTHDVHLDDYGIECTDCHHIFTNGKNVWTDDDPVEPCEKCHDPVKGQGKIYRLQDAFHKNCKGCHLEVNGGDVNGDAPFKCSGCHERRKR